MKPNYTTRRHILMAFQKRQSISLVAIESCHITIGNKNRMLITTLPCFTHTDTVLKLMLSYSASKAFADSVRWVFSLWRLCTHRCLTCLRCITAMWCTVSRYGCDTGLVATVSSYQISFRPHKVFPANSIKVKITVVCFAKVRMAKKRINVTVIDW